jgi:hypothetical protein
MVKKKIVQKQRQPFPIPLYVLGTIIIGIAAWFFGYHIGENNAESFSQKATNIQQLQTSAPTFDFDNATLSLNDQQLTFLNGSYSSYDANNIKHSADIIKQRSTTSGSRGAAIIGDDPGGSGTFSYLYGAMRTKDNATVYSTPIALGDRIKVTEITVTDPNDHDNGEITVSYLDHTPDEAMADAPTQEVTKKFAFQDDGNLIEVLP